MLDLQTIEQRANARTAAQPATSATPATRQEGAAGSKVAGVAAVAGDERIRCGSCSHYVERTRRCRNHRRAGLRSPLLGLDLPEMLQRCPGFVLGPSGASPNVGHSRPDASLFQDLP